MTVRQILDILDASIEAHDLSAKRHRQAADRLRQQRTTLVEDARKHVAIKTKKRERRHA